MNENMYNLNIERAVLSAIIFDPQIFEEIASKLKPHDFYFPFHQNLFIAMEELSREDKPIDDEFLKTKLTKGNNYNEVSMLDILAANAISNTNAYIDEIKARSTKRALATLATTIKKVTIEDDLPTDEIMNLVEKKLYEITQNSTSEDFKEAKEITVSMIDEINRLKSLGNSKLLGADTGFKNLNDKTSGFGKGDLVIIAARPAMGKCLSKGTKILMYSGELKEVENIVVGELLMGSDSTPRKVLSLARGEEEMYWVHQNKGIDYRVNKSHILSLKCSKNGDILNISVSDYLETSAKFKTNYKGYKVAVEFKEQPLTIEPYFLGIWLGGIKDDISLQKKLRDINLIKNKHIPKNYLINSRKNRLELLAGLLDSDGYYDDKFHVMEITQKLKPLAEQIKFLADSLGFRCSFNSKIVIGYECEVYSVRIIGNLDEIPTKIARKQTRPFNINHQHTEIKVEYDKVDNYYGFEIDGDRLFLLEDMTVTHNTSLVLNITQKAIERGEGVAFFSLEMPAEQLMLRLLSTETSIPLQKLRIGDLTDEQWSNLSKSADIMSTRKLFVDDGGYATIHHIRSKLRKLKSQHPEISMAIIDYLQLMSGDNKEGRQQVISEISRGLKQLARELEIPILALSQLNRGVESRDNKRPMLSDLRESGSIEQDADIVMFVYRDDVYREAAEKEKEMKAKADGKVDYKNTFKTKLEEETELILGKHRNGPTGTVNLIFQKQFTRFIDAHRDGEAPFETIYEDDNIDTSTQAKIGLSDNTKTPFDMPDNI
jgi:replicative DNA helicase